jgi:LacI family transcriptional regulator
MACPHCGEPDHQVKAGLHGDAQRYKCMHCLRRYVPAPKTRGYPEETRRRAVELHAQGMKIRQIGRTLGLNPRSIVNWVRQAEGAAKSAPDNAPHTVESAASHDSVVTRPAMKRLTIVDVAEYAGVSTSTVSNFLNDKGRMGTETRARIQAAVEELSFTPNSLIRAIRQRRTHIIGVVAFGLHDLDKEMNVSVSLPILSGINHGADEHGYNVLLYTGWPHRRRSMSGLDFLDGHIDGLIWVSPVLHTPLLKAVAKAGLPTVALLSRVVPDGVGYAVSDNIGGAKKLVAHLASLGHLKIAYIGPTDASDFQDRRAGYREGLKDCDLEWDPAMEAANERISKNWVTGDMTAFAEALDGWLSLVERPTAIMVASDAFAAWVIEAIRGRGFRVPEDVAVTGFDDLPAASYLCGGLTTVRQSFREIGRGGIGALARLIEGSPVESCRLTLATELVVRASTKGYEVR